MSVPVTKRNKALQWTKSLMDFAKLMQFMVEASIHMPVMSMKLSYYWKLS